MAHDSPNTRLALMPCASAASWSDAVARMAMPTRRVAEEGEEADEQRRPAAMICTTFDDRDDDVADLVGVEAPRVAEVAAASPVHFQITIWSMTIDSPIVIMITA